MDIFRPHCLFSGLYVGQIGFSRCREWALIKGHLARHPQKSTGETALPPKQRGEPESSVSNAYENWHRLGEDYYQLSASPVTMSWGKRQIRSPSV